jgi:DNA modification methylase
MSLLAAPFQNRVLHGDCVEVMRQMETGSVDFILTDPPYLVNYRSRDGRIVANDDNADWLEPAFQEMHRILKNGSFCLSFYGWNRADLFMRAWRGAGFRVLEHLVLCKSYTSSLGFFQRRHECAYLLAKGDVVAPGKPLPDVGHWHYTGNRLHPTQKSVRMLHPYIEAFCKPGGVVLDPFCGSGSTLVAARDSGRHYVGIELDRKHHQTTQLRLTL